MTIAIFFIFFVIHGIEMKTASIPKRPLPIYRRYATGHSPGEEDYRKSKSMGFVPKFMVPQISKLTGPQLSRFVSNSYEKTTLKPKNLVDDAIKRVGEVVEKAAERVMEITDEEEETGPKEIVENNITQINEVVKEAMTKVVEIVKEDEEEALERVKVKDDGRVEDEEYSGEEDQ